LSVARDPQPKQHLTIELFVSCHDSWNICGYTYRSRLPWNCIAFLDCDCTRRRLCHQCRWSESQCRTNRSISQCHCNKQVQFRGKCYTKWRRQPDESECNLPSQSLGPDPEQHCKRTVLLSLNYFPDLHSNSYRFGLARDRFPFSLSHCSRGRLHCSYIFSESEPRTNRGNDHCYDHRHWQL